MAIPDHATYGKVIYRRARPKDFDEVRSESGLVMPVPSLFVPDKEGEGLSVFDSTLASPVFVLQHYLDWLKERSECEDRSWRSYAVKLLKRHGTPEEMVETGWRVVAIPPDTFWGEPFSQTAPSSDPAERGHFEVFGSQDSFLIKSQEVVRNCRVLSNADSLSDELVH